MDNEKIIDSVCKLFTESSLEQLIKYAFKENTTLHKTVSKKIAIISRRLCDGGQERVTAAWAGLFNQAGYKVVLLTELLPSPGDYLVPDSVSRQVIDGNDKDYFYKLWQFCESSQVDTFVINDKHTELCYKRMLFLKCIGKKVIVVNHNSWYSPLHPDFIWSLSLKYKTMIYKLLDAVICLSRVDKSYFNWAGIERAVYIPNPSPFKADPMLRSKCAQPIILWVGRFSIEKQPELMIEAFNMVQRSVPESKLIMLGAGPLLNEAKQKAATLGLLDKIEFPGWVEVGNYFSNAAINCITSYTEAFPMVWLEAKAFGIPTVLFELNHLELSMVPGAIAVQQNDIAGLAKELVLLLKDLKQSQQLGEQAFNSLAKFGEAEVMSRWEKVFKGASGAPADDFKQLTTETIEPAFLNKVLFEQIHIMGNSWFAFTKLESLGNYLSLKELVVLIIKKLSSKLHFGRNK